METPYSTVMPVIPRSEAVFARGEGHWLEDQKGRRYLDFLHPDTGSYTAPMWPREKDLVEYSALNEVQQGGPDNAKAI